MPNRYLIEEGSRGHSMFVLHKGLVEVSANGRVVCRLKDGSVFGEMALLDISNRRTATVKTLERCDCAVIFRNVFFHILEKYPWERRKFQREAKRKLLQLGKLISVKGEDINLAQQASDLDALRQIPFFQQEEFSDDFVSEIALNVTSVFLKPGTLIMQEGDPPASKLYIMLRGVAEVSKDGQFLQRLEYAMLGDISAVGPGARARDDPDGHGLPPPHARAQRRAGDPRQVPAGAPAPRAPHVGGLHRRRARGRA